MSAELDTTTSAPASPVDVAAFLGLDPRRIETQALIAVANRYGLDPLLKHVVGIRSGGEIRPYITRDGLLHVAHASGQLDGIELVDGPTDRGDGYWHATVRVHRRDWSHPVTYPGRYPVQSGRDGEHRYGPEMAIKTAECMALRRAFPVGLAVLEEGPAWDVSAAVETDDATRADPPPPADGYGSLPPPRPGDEARSPTAKQLEAMWARLGELEVPREQMRDYVAGLVGRALPSSKELSRAEVGAVLDELAARVAEHKAAQPPPADAACGHASPHTGVICQLATGHPGVHAW